jgi:hypothetical protein
VVINWYSRLPSCCIHSWQQLKDKILLNFQGFQAELDTKEDFLSCVQKERKPLLEFYRRFLQLKAQAPELSDEQVIAQAIKALRVGPLHNHLVRKWSKIVPELYDQFAKFSKSKIQHFCKLEQQQKVMKPDEASRPRYDDSHYSYVKSVHSHYSIRELEQRLQRILTPLKLQNSQPKASQSNQQGGASNRGRGRGRGPYTPRPLYYMYHDNETDHRTKDCPIYIDIKRKMNQDTIQSSPQLHSREVNHTT